MWEPDTAATPKVTIVNNNITIYAMKRVSFFIVVNSAIKWRGL